MTVQTDNTLEVIDGVPQNQNASLKSIKNAQTVIASYSGPIPPSSELERYEGILPGAADRIVSMAEDLRHKEADLVKEGQQFGFIITIITIIAGAYLLLHDKGLEGTIFAGAGLVPVIAMFCKRNFTWFRKNQKDKK